MSSSNQIRKGRFYLILALDVSNDHPLSQVFQNIDSMLASLDVQSKVRTGRPRLYSDVQIVKCLVYQAFNCIFGFRELEWRLQHDPISKAIIGLPKVPDHSTFCLRAQELENTLYHQLYQLALTRLEADTRICFWDSTALRASRFDQEARKAKGTRIGWYIGYKLHVVVSDDLIPLTWEMTTANINDNKLPSMLQHLEQTDIFMILADSAYEDKVLFQAAEEVGIKLVTDVNLRRAKSVESIKEPYRKQNIQYRTSPLGQRMMKKRVTIERFFATLKIQYNLENSQLFGENRYQRHIMWVLFAYLCDRLVDKQNGVKTAKAPRNR